METFLTGLASLGETYPPVAETTITSLIPQICCESTVSGTESNITQITITSFPILVTCWLTLGRLKSLEPGY